MGDFKIYFSEYSFWNFYYIGLRSKGIWLFILPNYCLFFFSYFYYFIYSWELQTNKHIKNKTEANTPNSYPLNIISLIDLINLLIFVSN